jgi:signal transduction histidine kinase
MPSPTRPARTRSIRLTLAGLFIIPLASLVALWGFAASVTLSDTLAKRRYDSLIQQTGTQGQALLLQLSQERLRSFEWLGSGRRSAHEPLDAQRQRTDAAIETFRTGAGAAQGAMSSGAKQSLATLLAQLGYLGGIRNAIDFGAMNAPQAFVQYNGIVDDLFQFFDSQAAINDVALYQQAEANLAGDRALEMAGREDALIGEILAGGSRMTTADQVLFTQTVADQRFLEAEALSQLDAALAPPYRQLFSSPTYTRFKALEDKISGSAAGVQSTGRRAGMLRLPVSSATWQSAIQPFLTQFAAAGATDTRAVQRGLRQVGVGILVRLALAGGIGLLAVVASIFLMLRFGRRITRDLVGLHTAARKLAEERLPWVVGRLRRGEDVDVSAEVGALSAGKTKEIAKVADAFSTVQRTAVEAAVGQAQLRKGVNQVFLNLARRNQSLLHRQLDMLDAIERRTADPEALEDFFRLDHLTTRMRRHAESLIILSGEVPGRGWRRPVRVVDVLRAAIAEIEDYIRVDVNTESRDAVVGTAVADVIHMLAELIENATSFSPPNTRASITADRVGNGFVVEIEDRGLGIAPDELAETNKRLAVPPEFDLADSDRLGLFVVGQLAARHEIRVSLRESPFGGTTAIVLMPHSIVVPESEVDSYVGPVEAGLVTTPGARTDPFRATVAVGRSAQADVDGLNGRHRLPAEPPEPPGLQPVGAAHAATGPQEALWADPAGQAAPQRPAAQHAAGGTYLGLPRRVRQASLAPQLRDGPPADADDFDLTAPVPPPARSPEDVRTMMSSLQRGWQRGRSEPDPLSDGPDRAGFDPAMYLGEGEDLR